eukprot:Hpha_TRINITY_DN27314_c0_g1::TRINITY_DN27314_c0_g1_i1::g.613::m.613
MPAFPLGDELHMGLHPVAPEMEEMMAGVHVVHYPEFPDAPHVDLKARLVFAEMDSEHSALLTFDGFAACLRRLEVDIVPGRAKEIFESADLDGDGRLSFAEWMRFSETYPTLLDSLYYRAKDWWADRQCAEELAAASSEAAALRTVVEERRKACEAAQEYVAHCEAIARDEGKRLEEAEGQERDAQGEAAEAERLSHEKHGEVKSREEGLRAAHAQERKDREVLTGAQHAVERSARESAAQDSLVSAAEERLRELERAYQEQRREVARQKAAAELRRRDLSEMRQHEEEAELSVQDAEAATQEAARLLERAQAFFTGAQESERAARAEVTEVNRNRNVVLSMRGEREDALRDAHEQSRRAARVLADAEREQLWQERRATELQRQHEELRTQRASISAEESVMVEEELRLRKERYDLERRERQLRDCTLSPRYHGAPQPFRAASGGRVGSRSPSWHGRAGTRAPPPLPTLPPQTLVPNRSPPATTSPIAYPVAPYAPLPSAPSLSPEARRTRPRAQVPPDWHNAIAV